MALTYEDNFVCKCHFFCIIMSASLENIIMTEELYISGLGQSKDILLFERKTDIEENTTIKFPEEFENDDKSVLLKDSFLEMFLYIPRLTSSTYFIMTI